MRDSNSKSLAAMRLVLTIGFLLAAISISGCQRSPGSVGDSPGLAPEAVARSEIAKPSRDIHVVNFADPELEVAIRAAIGKLIGFDYTDLKNLKFLDASSRGISNLEGIQYCVNLEWLELGDNEIIDISALSSLINVKAFGLPDNEIVDISALSGLSNIWLLDLSNNQIADIAPIVNNEGIGIGDIIFLHENQLVRQSGTQNTLDIEALQRRGVDVLFTSSNVVNFPDPGLEAAIRETIGKPTGNILDIYLIELTFLDANERSISSLEGIQHCVDLEKLLLRGSGIADFTLLLSLARLRWLDLSDNENVDMSMLSGLTNLTELWLASNEIADISTLSNLTSLRTLYLSDNEIIDISALSGLTDLWLLGLGENQIVDVSELSGLDNLEMLILGHNDITDISALSGLTNLKHLYLSHNEVIDISVLLGLTHLKTLALDNNQISDILVLVANSDITSMDWVDLRHNALDLTHRSPDMLNIEALEDRGVYVDFDPQN